MPNTPTFAQPPHKRPPPRRRLIGAAFGLALASLPHCAFPEFEFRETTNGTGGSGGAAGSAGAGAGGQGGVAGQGGPSGQGGSAGQGAACPPACEPFVVAAAEAPISSHAVFGGDAFWTQFVSQQTNDLLLSKPLEGGNIASLLTNGGEVVNPRLGAADDNFLFLLAPGESPGQLLAFDRQGGEVRSVATFTEFDGAFASESSFFYASFNVNADTQEIFRVPRADAGAPVRIADPDDGPGLFLAGADGEAAIIVDEDNGRLLRASRPSNDEQTDVDVVFDADGRLPYFFSEAVADETSLYFASFGNEASACTIQSIERGGGQFVVLTPSEADCVGLRADETTLYWTRFDSPHPLRAMPKDGSSPPRTVVEAMGATDYALHNGYVYWVSEDSRSLMGLRLR